MNRWFCCQIGAREHYAVPRALDRRGSLERLITDGWIKPTSLLACVVGRQRSEVRGRWDEELASAQVIAFNASLMGFELVAQIRGMRGWERVIARNQFFQQKAVNWLRKNTKKLKSENSKIVLFSYSYAAGDIFRFAKEQGWETIMGQIDPGPVEEEIVRSEHRAQPEFAADWKPAPQEYWEHWREECALADHIIVNSEWSRSCLCQAGVAGDKLSVVPLAYEPPNTNVPVTRIYPERFTPERPLRVLFLGQINLRKGVAHLLEAAASLRNEPVEFWMVGSLQVKPAQHLRNLPNVRWFGRTSRDATGDYYRKADVFILPTLSDGFALTQLEAQSYGLPIIASKRCGRVVENGVNGLVLEQPTAGKIERAIRAGLENPCLLQGFAARSSVTHQFSIGVLGHCLQDLAERLGMVI